MTRVWEAQVCEEVGARGAEWQLAVVLHKKGGSISDWKAAKEGKRKLFYDPNFQRNRSAGSKFYFLKNPPALRSLPTRMSALLLSLACSCIFGATLSLQQDSGNGIMSLGLRGELQDGVGGEEKETRLLDRQQETTVSQKEAAITPGKGKYLQ